MFIAYISVDKPAPWAVAGPLGSWRVSNWVEGIKDAVQQFNVMLPIRV